MDEKKLSGYLMSATAIVAACLAIAVIAVVPAAGEAILYDYPEFSGWYMPWLAIRCPWPGMCDHRHHI